MNLPELRIDQLLEKLASSAPTPGGGSVAGLAAAKAASLLQMVVGLTKGDTLQQLIPELKQSKEEALALANEDSRAFEKVMRAYRLAKNTDEEIKERRGQIQSALKAATIIPLQTMRVGLKLLKIATPVVEQGNPNAISDVGVASLLAYSAIKGGYYNVLINLQSIKDQSMVDSTEQEATQIFHQADHLAGKIEKRIISELTGNKID